MQYFQYQGDILDYQGNYCIPKWAIELHKKGILFCDVEQDHQNGLPYDLYIKKEDRNIFIPVGNYVVQDKDEIYTCEKVGVEN